MSKELREIKYQPKNQLKNSENKMDRPMSKTEYFSLATKIKKINNSKEAMAGILDIIYEGKNWVNEVKNDFSLDLETYDTIKCRKIEK
jgi:hypothetical protein